MKYTTFEQMPVWRNAMDLAADIHGLTERLPRKEDYGLTSQIRRSGLSVSGSLAEGFGREHSKDVDVADDGIDRKRLTRPAEALRGE
jgi:hypothetical protein